MSTFNVAIISVVLTFLYLHMGVGLAKLEANNLKPYGEPKPINLFTVIFWPVALCLLPLIY